MIVTGNQNSEYLGGHKGKLVKNRNFLGDNVHLLLDSIRPS